MPEVTAKAGDTLLAIARESGFLNWKTIWEYPQNQALRDGERDPQFLFEGDKVFVPEKKPKEVTCVTGHVHRFVVPVPFQKPPRLHLVLRDDAGTVLGDVRFKLTLGEKVVEGRTSKEGNLDEELPAGSREATLEVWAYAEESEPSKTWHLDFGPLAPPTDLKGIQARLANLGFYEGEGDGTMDDATRQALREFRASAGLDSNAEKLDGPDLVEALTKAQGG